MLTLIVEIMKWNFNNFLFYHYFVMNILIVIIFTMLQLNLKTPYVHNGIILSHFRRVLGRKNESSLFSCQNIHFEGCLLIKTVRNWDFVQYESMIYQKFASGNKNYFVHCAYEGIMGSSVLQIIYQCYSF